jgi:AraC-like DNA-binding protein
MKFDFLNIALLLGATQGFLLSFLIFQKHRKLYANRFLSMFMFLYSLILAQMLLNDLGYGEKIPHVLLVFLGLPFLIGPLHFLYAKSLINFSAKMKKNDWLHFLPFVVVELYFLSYLFKTNQQIQALFDKQQVNDVSTLFIIHNWLIIIQGMIYLIYTIILINKYSKNIKNIFSTIEKIKLNWLKIITYMVIFVLNFFMIENFLMLFNIQLSYHFNLTSFLYAILIYVLGYIGFSKSEIYAEPEFAELMNHLPKYDQKSIEQKTMYIPKYEKSGLSQQKAKQYLESLLILMEEKEPFRDSELTLNQLAEILAITPHNLSEVLNTKLNQNFFDFVNNYRIEHVKKDLVDPEKQNLKILSIAFDSGFNSKTSFNTIFKKDTGLTPSQYRMHNLNLNAWFL